LLIEGRVQMKLYVRLVIRTTCHSFLRHCTVGGSNPVASSAGTLSTQLRSNESRLHRCLDGQSIDA